MRAFDVAALEAARAASGRLYHEFLRVPSLSLGLYRVAAGAEDPQRPHAEDEAYFVLEGRGKFTSGGVTRDVSQGDVLFVPAREAHRFHDVTGDLSLLVFFAPAESST